jgi:hypothetical protein
MSGKIFTVVFMLMLTAIIVAPSAFAESLKGLGGYADKYLGGTLSFEDKEIGIWKGSGDGGDLFSKFGGPDPLHKFHGENAGFWRGDGVIEDRRSWIPDGLIVEDLAVSEPKGYTEIKGFENTGILVGLSYSFSNFRLRDLRKSINTFLTKFDLTAPRSGKSVSVYIAFSEF